MRCVACLQGQLWECQQEGKCNDDGIGESDPLDAGGNDDAILRGTADIPETDDDGSEDGSESDEGIQIRTYKDDSALRDQQSTGRKRAAKLFPLDEDARCEWKMKANCGGGEFPIVGCTEGLQEARHHGPDKNTLNNEDGNVHRICHKCHNRWHTLNDDTYVWGGMHNPHEPHKCNLIDIALNEEFWADRKVVKAKD